jgi:pimeloyl-ACP methyl ester carboxylesterase
MLNRTDMAELRGVGRMLVDATAGVVDVVERMHRTVQEVPWLLGTTTRSTTRGLTGYVYRGVRGGVRLAGWSLESTLGAFEGRLPPGASTPSREAFISALNGVYGDQFARTGNPLAIPMSLRRDGAPIDVADVAALVSGRRRPKLLVLLHGLCMSDRQWTRDGHDHGAALADDLGYLPIHVRYNSGLSIAQNGELLAERLQALFAAFPRPLDEFVILGHSMGGLVARSACAIAAERRDEWLASLTRLVFLGTPHGGAPLERAGNGLEFLMNVTPYSAPIARLGRARSAGIKDLRRGTITAAGHRFVPLPAGVACYTIAASLGARRNVLGDRLIGDGLVPVRSALGHGRDDAHTLRFADDRQWVGHGMGHLDLLSRPEVYARLRTWMSARPSGST